MHGVREEETIRNYFGQPGFARFLKLLEKQYMSSKEGIRGYVTLTNIREEERLALDTFYETYSSPKPGETKRYSIKKFEQLLLKSRFQLTVAALLALMKGEPVYTRQQLDHLKQSEWRLMIATVLDQVRALEEYDPEVIEWAQGLAEQSSPGSRTLKMVYAKSREEAVDCLRYGLMALNRIKMNKADKPIRLPILAAEITGDAHALDWKYPMGRLFWWGLTAIFGEPANSMMAEEDQPPSTSMEPTVRASSQAILIREGLRRGGVADDDLSSQVMLYAPELFGVREERILTLRQVEHLIENEFDKLVQLHCEIVHMVENPSVFAELIDADAQRWSGPGSPAADSVAPFIICGNGQPTTAVVKLLDALLNGCHKTLYYAGDLDPVGLSIAQSLQFRYPEAMRAWRMDASVYLRYAEKGIPLAEGERTRLAEARYPWEPELAEMMHEHGVKLHQELWVEELVQDVLMCKGFAD